MLEEIVGRIDSFYIEQIDILNMIDYHHLKGCKYNLISS